MAAFQTLAGSAPRRGQPPPVALTDDQKNDVAFKAQRAESIKRARSAGHDDATIAAELAKHNPGAAAALAAGHSPYDVLNEAVSVRPLGSQEATLHYSNQNVQHIETGARSRDYKAHETANPVSRGAHIAADYKAGGGMSDALNASANPLAIALRASPGVQGGARVLDTLGGAANVVNEGLTRQYRRGGGTESGASNIKDSLNLFESFIPVGDVVTGAKGLAGALKVGARAAAPAVSRGAALASKLATPLTEEQKIKLALGRVRPNEVRSVMAPQAKSLHERAINASTEAERVANEQAAQLAAALESHKAAEAAAIPNTTLGVGNAGTLSERGAAIREPAVAAREEIYNARQAVDDELRPVVQQRFADLEAAKKYASDTKEGRALLAQSRRALRPDPVTSPTATPRLLPEERRIHSDIVRALEKRQVQLTPEQADAARALGHDVPEIDGVPTRTFKNTYDALDNLGRRFGSAFETPLGGASAVSKTLARTKRTQIEELLNNAAPERRAMQDNWKKGSDALDLFDETKQGRALTGTQGSTDVLAATEASLPKSMMAGGRQWLRDYANTPGIDRNAVLQSAKNELEAAFKGKDANALDEALGPNGRLRDFINGLPDVLGTEGKLLKAKVEQHIEGLNDARHAGVRAKELKVGAETAGQNAEKATAARDAANALRAKAGLWNARLEKAKPDEAIKVGFDVVEELRKIDGIDPEKVDQFNRWLVVAERKNIKSQNDKDAVLKWIPWVVGVTGVGGTAYLASRGISAASATARAIGE